MKIKTKFDLLQKVYFIFEPDKAIISGIVMGIHIYENCIIYLISNEYFDYNSSVEEQRVYKTKSEAEQALKRLEGK